MSDLMLLTDAEIDAVAGGAVTIGSFAATLTNSSTITQTATSTATNSGAVTATNSGLGGVAAAVGASSSAANVADVDQHNSVSIRD